MIRLRNAGQMQVNLVAHVLKNNWMNLMCRYFYKYPDRTPDEISAAAVLAAVRIIALD